MGTEPHIRRTASPGESSPDRAQRATALLVVSLCLGVASGATAYRVATQHRQPRSALLRRGPASGPVRYSLSALRIFSDVLQRVRDTYVDPSRIRPNRMLLGALEALGETVPEVLVRLQDDGQRLRLRVGDHQRDFDLSGVRSLHTLYRTLKAVVSFVEAHLEAPQDLRRIEYACINGVLSTLDPHSVLWDPQTYQEMKVGTRGAFGGLGIVISIRDGILTVVAPIDGTPAARAGLRAGDQIVRIGSESTVNMSLTEAVNRLRGEPGTKVVLYVSRTGEPKPLRFEVVRAIIKWKTVVSRVLEGNVGYVRIKHFSRTTARDLTDHLKRLMKRPLVGLVLDLSNNPGGLLDQAVKVADQFLTSGTIVATVGNAGTQREVRRASRSALAGTIPLVVLVNAGSASASEIVAGALQNQDRAVLLGEPTFGKGSVQVLYDNWDGSALKLTIAQYLTPGNVSIQSVGIAPDVHLIPVRVTRERIVFYAATHRRRERDLAAHLDAARARRRAAPVLSIRYLETPRKPSGDAADPEDEGGGADPAVVRLARDLLLRRFGARRTTVLRLAREFLAARRQQESRRIAAALRALGIDWSLDPPHQVPMLEAAVSTADGRRVYRAGETVGVRVSVTNLGGGPAYRVRAISRSGRPVLAEREFFFGRIAPGETRHYAVRLQIPKSARSGIWRMRLSFAEAYGHAPPDANLRLRIGGSPPPLLAARVAVYDPPPGGNGDGLLGWGESVRLRLWMRNVGQGPARRAVAVLKNLGGAEVFLHRGHGRVAVGPLPPGAERTGAFRFDLHRTAGVEAVRLRLRLADEANPEADAVRTLILPVSPTRRTVVPAQGWVVVQRPRAPLRTGAAPTALEVATVEPGTALPITGRAGGFYRITHDSVGTAFLRVDDAGRPRPAPPPQPGPAPRLRYHVTPPLLVVDRYPLATRSASVAVSATAVDDRRVRDGYISVRWLGKRPRRQKITYLSNRNARDPTLLWLRARVPIAPGVNQITFVARDEDRVQSVRTIEVLREDAHAPGLAAAPSGAAP